MIQRLYVGLMHMLFLFFLGLLCVFCAVHANNFIFFFYHQATAFFTLLLCRLIPCGKLTFWKFIASVKNFSAFSRTPLN